MSNLSRPPIPFDRPATYRISVQGRIDPSWSDRLQGMTITPAAVDVDPLLTSLEGEVIDQAALAGVLMTLYELHLTLLSVQLLEKG